MISFERSLSFYAKHVLVAKFMLKYPSLFLPLERVNQGHLRVTCIDIWQFEDSNLENKYKIGTCDVNTIVKNKTDRGLLHYSAFFNRPEQLLYFFNNIFDADEDIESFLYLLSCKISRFRTKPLFIFLMDMYQTFLKVMNI